MAYPDLDDLKGYVGEPLTETRHDSTLTAALNSAVAKVEAYTDRYFDTDAAASTKQIIPGDPRKISIRDFYETDALVLKTDADLDGTYETTWTIGTDFYVGPLDQRSGYPYYTIQALGTKIFPNPGVYRRPTVQVEAKWGWAAIPADVHETVLELAAAIWKRRDAPFGVAGFDEMGSMVQISPSDRRILVKIDYLKRYGALQG